MLRALFKKIQTLTDSFCLGARHIELYSAQHKGPSRDDAVDVVAVADAVFGHERE